MDIQFDIRSSSKLCHTNWIFLWQLAYDIDREVDDQNDYLDNMVSQSCLWCKRFLRTSRSYCRCVLKETKAVIVFSLFVFQDSNFMSATGLLSGSVKRFSTMVRSGKDNRRLLCYVSGGLVLAFFLLYYLVSRIQTWFQENIVNLCWCETQTDKP